MRRQSDRRRILISLPASDVEQLDHQLDAAGVKREILVYPGAPYSFFDRRYWEFADPSTDDWKRMLAFIRLTDDSMIATIHEVANRSPHSTVMPRPFE